MVRNGTKQPPAEVFARRAGNTLHAGMGWVRDMDVENVKLYEGR
jgi:hypothetical protein